MTEHRLTEADEARLAAIEGIGILTADEVRILAVARLRCETEPKADSILCAAVERILADRLAAPAPAKVVEELMVSVRASDLRQVLGKAEYVEDKSLRGPVDRMGDALLLATMKRDEWEEVDE